MIHVMGPTATGVVGGGNSGDKYPPDLWCAGVVRLGDKFPSLILKMDCHKDMLHRMAFDDWEFSRLMILSTSK